MAARAPNLVPHFDVTVHIVLDDYGKAGRVYRETAEEDTTIGSVVDDLLTGQFNNPVRVVAFNTAEGWSRDVSEDVTREVVRRVVEQGRTLAASSRPFVETYVADELARLRPRVNCPICPEATHQCGQAFSILTAPRQNSPVSEQYSA
jgi:hypothetical protein